MDELGLPLVRLPSLSNAPGGEWLVGSEAYDLLGPGRTEF